MAGNEDFLIAEIARLEAQLAVYRELAYHDALTGLHNRRYFEERLAEELSRADRSYSRVALVMIDLDNFKQINDSAGHAAGDGVLRHIARILSSEARSMDIVCRVGGDEFAILLPCTDGQGAAAFIARVRDRIEDDAAGAYRVKASMGAAVYPDDASVSAELALLSDAQMYADKEKRKRLAALHAA
jgi:diguanylate cyclase (GGDEF)-like protein